MPINQYGEDPEALTPIDLDAAEEAFKRREQRTGKPAMTQEEIAAGMGIDIGAPQEDTIAGPPELLGTATPMDISKFAAEARAKTVETLKAPTQVGVGTPQDLMWDFHQRGFTMGESMGHMERLYEAKSPLVMNLAGIDEFVRKIPKARQRWTEGATLGLIKPLVRLGAMADNLLSGTPVEKYLFPGIDLKSVGEGGLKEIAKLENQQVPLTSRPGQLNAIYNSVPGMIGETPLWMVGAKPLTGMALGGILRLPRYAEAAAEIARVSRHARLGNALLAPSAKAASRFAEASVLANVGGQVGTGAAISYLQEHDVTQATLGNLILMGGLAAGGALFRGFRGRGGKGAAIYGPKNLTKITHYIAEKTGIPATTLIKDLNNFGAVYSKLQEMKAPDIVMKTFLDGVPKEEWGKEVGAAFGRYLATKGELPQDIQRLMNLLPPSGREMVFESWGAWVKAGRQARVLKERQARRAAEVGPRRAKVAEGIRKRGVYTAEKQAYTEEAIRQGELRLDEEEAHIIEGWRKDFLGTTPSAKIDTIPVHPVGENLNGGVIYRDPQSRIGLGATTTRTVEEVLGGPKGTHGKVVLNDGTTHVMRSDYVLDSGGDIRLGDGTYRHVSSVKDVLDFNGKSKLTTPNVVSKPFSNPITVPYDPATELWSEAVIRQLSRPTVLGKEALYVLNRYKFKDSAEYQAVAHELAMRVAGKSGWGSIFAKGRTANDSFYVDLAGHKGGDVSDLVKKIEAQAINRARSFFDQYPMTGSQVARAQAKASKSGKALIKYGVPIAIGYGLYAEPSDAAMLPGPLKELVTKLLSEARVKAPRVGKVARDIEDTILNLDPPRIEGPRAGVDIPLPVEKVMDRLYQESPVTGHLFESVVTREAAITGDTSIDSAVRNYNRVLESLKEPLEIRSSIGGDPIPATYENRMLVHGTPVVYDKPDITMQDPDGLYGPGFYMTHHTEIGSGYAKTRRTAVGGRPDTGIERASNVRPLRIKPGTKFVDVDTIPLVEEKAALVASQGVRDLIVRSMGFKDVANLQKSGNIIERLLAQYNGEGISKHIERYFETYPNATWDKFYQDMSNGVVVPGTYVNKIKLRKMFEELGYDGITHIGGRGDNKHHRVWIAFDPNKSTEPYSGHATNPIPAFATIIHEPTLAQHVERLQRASRNQRELTEIDAGAEGPIFPGGTDTSTVDVNRLRKIREQNQSRGDNYYIDTKTPKEYGAGLTQNAAGTAYRDLEKQYDSGVLEFEIGHDLAADKIARIGGYIDPVDHHWYVREKDAADWGLGKAALDSLVQAGIAAGIIKGIKTNYKAIALVAAATGAVGLLGAGPADAMPPWGKLIGKGAKGMPVVDSWVGDIAGVTTQEGVHAVTNAIKQVAKDGTPKTFGDTAEALFAAGDVAPERAFTPEFRDIFTLGHDPGNILTTGSEAIKLPAYAIEDPLGVWVRLHSDAIIRKEEQLTGKNSVAVQTVRQLDDIFGDTEWNIDELLNAADGLVRDGNTGILRQGKSDATMEATRIAQRLREEIDDPIFEFYHGIRPQAQAILREAGLKETEDTWKLLRWLQELDITQGVPNWGNRKVTSAEMIAAGKMEGMLHWEPWQDLDTASSSSGILSKFPLANQQAQLLREVKRLSDLYPQGVPDELKTQFNAINNKLIELKTNAEKVRRSRSVNLNRLPKKHFWGPRTESKELGLRIGLENDPRKIMAHYIHGALGQAYFNEMLYKFRGVAAFFDHVGQPEAATYARRYINTQRGLRSIKEDAWISPRIDRINQSLGKVLKYNPNRKTVENVRKYADFATRWMYIGKLALNPAFLAMNITQPILTNTLPLKYLPMALPHALTNGAVMAEAGNMGILRAASHYAEETGGIRGKAMKVADWAPNKSENFNRTLVYQAGKTYALDQMVKGKFRIQKHIAPYFNHSILDSGKATPEQVAREYGAALSRSTQFLQGPEGRPLFFTGGALRRAAGQFKSFTAGYANLFRATLYDDKPAMLRLIGQLITLGGIGALPFGEPIADGIRAGVAALGLDPNLIPDGSPIGKVWEVLMGSESPIQLSGSANPLPQNLNPFGDAGKAFDAVAGPTAGTIRQGGKALWDFGVEGKLTGSEAFTGVAKPLFPGTLGVAGLEALQETGVLKELFDAMNYRGGIYSPTGEPLVRQRSGWDIAARAGNLQPSVRSQRSNYKYEIIEALEKEDYTRAKTFMKKADKEGFLFDKRDLGNMKAIITKKERLKRPNQRIPR